MFPAAKLKVADRLAAAEESAANLVAVRDHPTTFKASEFRREWFAFLTAAAGVYTVLEQGMKDSAANRAWFEERKLERKTDPLLTYVYEARNADHHSVEPVTSTSQGRLAFVQEGVEVAALEDMNGNSGTLRSKGAKKGQPIELSGIKELRIYPDTPKLLPIKYDRGSRRAAPPTEHLGNAIDDQHPATVALVALAYLQRISLEASRR